MHYNYINRFFSNCRLDALWYLVCVLVCGHFCWWCLMWYQKSKISLPLHSFSLYILHGMSTWLQTGIVNVLFVAHKPAWFLGQTYLLFHFTFIFFCCSVADLSHSETRLSVYLDSFELHVYNRTAVYSNLEQLFGIDQLLPRPSESAPEYVQLCSALSTLCQYMPVIFSDVDMLCCMNPNYWHITESWEGCRWQ